MAERVLVCGGRDYVEMDTVSDVLDGIHHRRADGGIGTVISGTATGADTLGEVWAMANRVPVERYEPDWAKYGRAAGPVRNRQMLVEGKPTLVVAFPGGRGTANMIKQARAAGVPVLEVSRG